MIKRAGWPMWAVWAGAAALALWACTPANEDDDDEEPIPDAAVDVGLGGTGGMGGMDADAGMGGMGGGMGGMGGGMGGMGGMLEPETPVEERCPDAQFGTFLLVLFPDRVDAYRQRDFGASYFCRFLSLSENGITNATGMAIDRDGTTIYVVQPQDDAGSVYAFDTNGAFVRKVVTNINLGGIDGIWNTFGDRFVAWSATSQNFYELAADGSYRTLYSPPQWQGSRVDAVTDVLFLDADAMLATFSDRPAQLFKAPFAPEWPADEVGPGNAVTGVETEEGVKLLMTAQVGGEGNGYGVLVYEPAISGRAPPELESVLVRASEEVVDGIDIIGLGNGMLVLDSNLAGTAKITSYNAMGEFQQTIPLEIVPGEANNPRMMLLERVFPDF